MRQRRSENRARMEACCRAGRAFGGAPRAQGASGSDRLERAGLADRSSCSSGCAKRDQRKAERELVLMQLALAHVPRPQTGCTRLRERSTADLSDGEEARERSLRQTAREGFPFSGTLLPGFGPVKSHSVGDRFPGHSGRYLHPPSSPARGCHPPRLSPRRSHSRFAKTALDSSRPHAARSTHQQCSRRTSAARTPPPLSRQPAARPRASSV